MRTFSRSACPHNREATSVVRGLKGPQAPQILRKIEIEKKQWRKSTQQEGHISPQALDALAQQHWQAISESQDEAEGKLTHFEAVTALAFRHFADEKVDLAVIETGLGGLTDATNVIPAEQLAAAVITPIGLEHVEALGGSLESIATAKAGIMKQGRPVIIAEQKHSLVLDILLKQAAKMGCPVLQAGRQVVVKHEGYSLGGHQSDDNSSVAKELVSVSWTASGMQGQQVIDRMPDDLVCSRNDDDVMIALNSDGPAP
eukprot:gene17753-24115_t